MGSVSLLLSYGLLFLAALVLYLPVMPTPIELSDTDIGYLRRGTRGAVLTALTALRAHGLIAIRQRGGVRRTSRAMAAGGDGLERAVYGALHSAAGPRSVATKPAVRRALATTAERLAGAGLIPGRFRRSLGRAMLIAVAILGIVSLSAGDAGTPMVVGLCLAMILAGCLWLPSRRTVAGHGVLGMLRREHARLIAGWSPTEHNPHDSSLDAKLENGVGMATGASLFTKGLALGLVVDLVAAGIHAVEGDGVGYDVFGWNDGFDTGEHGSYGSDYTPA